MTVSPLERLPVRGRAGARVGRPDHRCDPAPRRPRRLREEPARALDRGGRARPELTRAAVDDAGLPVLVALDLRAQHARDLWPDRLRLAARALANSAAAGCRWRVRAARITSKDE